MSELLDEEYLTWLYSQIGSVKLKNPARTYWTLARQLYTKEFVWFVPNDDNRVEDGRELRHEFINECDISSIDPAWMDLGCSFLEMMIALSRRLAFQGEGEPRGWFFTLLEHLGLEKYTDLKCKRYSTSFDEIEEIVDAVIYRQYEPDGRGGLFPLQHPERDQRKVEIWYQMSAYLIEREEG